MLGRVGERDGLGGERRLASRDRDRDQEGEAPAVRAALAYQCGLVLDRELVEALFVSVPARRMARARKVKRRVSGPTPDPMGVAGEKAGEPR